MGIFDFFKKKNAEITMELSDGTMLILDEHYGEFHGTTIWSGVECDLNLHVDSENSQTAHTSRGIFEQMRADEEKYDKKIKAYAVEELVSLACDWEDREVTREEFLQRITLVQIFISPDGEYVFWFDADEMFADHTIEIRGNIEHGLEQSDIVG